MAFTTIDDPSKFFQTVLYTGNGSSQSTTFDGNSDMQPDLLWTKNRDSTFDPIMRDTSRGISERLLVVTTELLVKSYNSFKCSPTTSALIAPCKPVVIVWPSLLIGNSLANFVLSKK